MNSRARTDVDDNRRRRRDRHRPAHAALRARGARRGGSGSASCERPLVLALAPPDLSGANARVDARPSMKDEALPHCGSDGERRGRAADAAAGPVLARPNFFRTCLPPRDVVDRATERLNPPRFRAICTVAYRSPPAQDCLSRRRSPVRIRLGVLTNALEIEVVRPACSVRHQTSGWISRPFRAFSSMRFAGLHQRRGARRRAARGSRP